MPNYPAIESMCSFTRSGLLVRVWRQETEVLDAYPNDDLLEATLVNDDGSGWTIKYLAEFLAEQPRVNAVEVKDLEGNGVVIYTVWP